MRIKGQFSGLLAVAAALATLHPSATAQSKDRPPSLHMENAVGAPIREVMNAEQPARLFAEKP